MKRGTILGFIIFLIFLISLIHINAFDSQTFQSCGGDSELTIGCVGDEELFFMGAEPSEGVPTPPLGGDGARSLDINFTPTYFIIDIPLGDKIEKTVAVTNFGNSVLNISLSQQNLGGMAILRENYLYLNAKETKIFSIAFIDKNETGIFPGKIIIGDKEILVTLNVRTKLLLFDSNIAILNKDYKVSQSQKLKTSITLIPLGDEERLDVTLKYIIKDYSDKIFLEESETVLVEEQIEIKKNFNTGMLPIGEYIIGLELIYPNGIATSSARFEIIKKKLIIPSGKLIFYIMIFILIASILIVTILIKIISKRNSETKHFNNL